MCRPGAQVLSLSEDEAAEGVDRVAFQVESYTIDSLLRRTCSFSAEKLQKLQSYTSEDEAAEGVAFVALQQRS